MPRFRNASFGLRLAKLTIGADWHAEEPKKYLFSGSLATSDRCMPSSAGAAWAREEHDRTPTLRQCSATALVNSPQSKLRHCIHNRCSEVATDVCLSGFIEPGQPKDRTGIDD